jgi:hypothetical protein
MKKPLQATIGVRWQVPVDTDGPDLLQRYPGRFQTVLERTSRVYPRCVLEPDVTLFFGVREDFPAAHDGYSRIVVAFEDA